MSNDITAPGRSALWTQAALAALMGAAAPIIVSDNDGEEEFNLDHDAIVADAMAIADRFERRCIERHAREQAEGRDRKARALAEDEEQVRRVGRYRIRVMCGVEGSGEWRPIVITVDRVKDGLVYFHAHPEWNHGQPKCVPVRDILDEDEGFVPMPLTDADLPAVPTVALDALPIVAGMADADALLRAAMAERGKTAG